MRRHVRYLPSAILVVACNGCSQAEQVSETAAPPPIEMEAAEAIIRNETHIQNVEAVFNFIANLPESTDFLWEDSSDEEDNDSPSHPEWLAALDADEMNAALNVIHTFSLRSIGYSPSAAVVVPDIREFVSGPAATSDGTVIREFIMPVGRRGFVAAAGCTSTGERAIVWDRALRTGNQWPYYVAYIRSHEMAHHADPRQISCAPVQYARSDGLEIHTHCETVRSFAGRLPPDDLEYFLFHSAGLGDRWTQGFLADASLRATTCGWD